MLVDAELPLEGAELFDELGPEAVVLGLVTLGLADDVEAETGRAAFALLAVTPAVTV